MITRQGEHIPTHRGIGQAHLLICGQLIQPLKLVTDPGRRFEIEPFGVALHLLGEQGLKLIAAALEHHRHLAQDAVILL